MGKACCRMEKLNVKLKIAAQLRVACRLGQIIGASEPVDTYSGTQWLLPLLGSRQNP